MIEPTADQAMSRAEDARVATLGGTLRTAASRMERAIRLDSAVFREAAADQGATYQALVVVLLGAGATALALGGGWSAAPGQLFMAYIGWITGALLTVVISRHVFRVPREQADWSSVARAMGFAHAPVLLRVLGVLPGVSVAMFMLTAAWQGLALLMAIREAVGYPSYWKPLGIVVLGFIPYVLVAVWFSRLL